MFWDLRSLLMLRIGFPSSREPTIADSLTDANSICPRSLLKTIPPPSGYSWIPEGQEGLPELKFRGLMLEHNVLSELELKNMPKLFLRGY